MDFMKYDYYGNYDNNDDLYKFNIHDIHKKQKEKETYRIKIYERIASKLFRKIKETSENEDTYCFFQIPIYIPGLPIYNLTECVMFLLNLIQEKGFKGRYCDNCVLYVSWKLTKSNLRLIENKKDFKTTSFEDHNPKKNIIDQLNLKYKPIESYTAFSNFLPRKKL
jgi:hypothetical protein